MHRAAIPNRKVADRGDPTKPVGRPGAPRVADELRTRTIREERRYGSPLTGEQADALPSEMGRFLATEREHIIRTCLPGCGRLSRCLQARQMFEPTYAKSFKRNSRASPGVDTDRAA